MAVTHFAETSRRRPMHNLRIRGTLPSDLPIVRALLAETWHHTNDSIMGAEKVSELTREWHAIDRLQAELARPDHISSSRNAMRSGTLAAAVRGTCCGSTGSTCCRPSRGRGLGPPSCARPEDLCPTAALVRVNVHPENTRALAFYRRDGFSAEESAGRPDEIVLSPPVAALSFLGGNQRDYAAPDEKIRYARRNPQWIRSHLVERLHAHSAGPQRHGPHREGGAPVGDLEGHLRHGAGPGGERHGGAKRAEEAADEDAGEPPLLEEGVAAGEQLRVLRESGTYARCARGSGSRASRRSSRHQRAPREAAIHSGPELDACDADQRTDAPQDHGRGTSSAMKARVTRRRRARTRWAGPIADARGRRRSAAPRSQASSPIGPSGVNRAGIMTTP